MKRSFWTARWMIVAASLTVLTGSVSVIAACSSHDSASGPSASGSSASAPSASGPSASAPSGADAATLYSRLGGNAGIKAIAAAMIDAALRDPVIATYFGAGDPKPVLKATLEQDVACLTLQLGQAAGGPEVYPGQVAGGFTCRSMTAAHAGLAIDGAVFDRFIGIAAGVLKAAQVADDDIATLGVEMIGLKAQVVSVHTTNNDAGPFPSH
jgi:hypothetical protein